jgi:hypothetical protein
MRRPLALLLLLPLLAAPGRAQQFVVVVPPGSTVTVPSRGDTPARSVATARRPRVARLAPLQPAKAEAGVTTAQVLVPLAAAATAALAATLASGGSGSGTGVSAPVRTR